MHVLFTPRFPLDVVAKPRSDIPEYAYCAYQAAKGRYMQHVPLAAYHNQADIEDWHENIAWLLAAHDAGLDVHILDRITPLPERAQDIKPLISLSRPFDPNRPFALFGPQPLRARLTTSAIDGQSWPSPAGAAAANRYASNPAFQRHAGRQVQLCDVEGTGLNGKVVHSGQPSEITHALENWAAAGPVDALIKNVFQPKYGPLYPVELPAGAHPVACKQAVYDALSYDLLDLEGRTQALLLQGRIEMRDEYRIFVIGGRVVTGAGCIERHTPWDRIPGETFDPQMENLRGSGGIRVDRARAKLYRQFAERIVPELMAEDPELRDFSLDLAVNADGAPLIIELNPVATSGLYACRIEKLVGAIRDQHAYNRIAAA
ncbi:hypothetical protein CKO28_03020 [Rhodovibrio sodomensis]|uniref:ATP-grasp domain-containing protein n=1 Tax=Rhodovibrio sodomensis TaxID=1088 RepID=A0ABS1D9J3_9PROT|nr:ATP-grasp domain-containing protein [Rhodovibrio sodomensis]MBK1667015.1 hypothetical protein [Rhodovibrio sodomensis]